MTVSVKLVLVTVTDCAALLLLTIWLPKAIASEDRVKTGGGTTPVPVSATVGAALMESLFTVSAAVVAPSDDGV